MALGAAYWRFLKQADFIGHIFSATKHRPSVIKFGCLLPAKELITMLSSPRVVSHDGLATFFGSFSRTLWLLLAFGYLLVGALHWTEGLSWGGMEQGGLRGWLLNYVEMFALLVGQGSVHLSWTPRRLLRNPLLLWILAALLLRTLFANFITAFLLSRSALKLDYFRQLSTPHSALSILIVGHSTSHYFFMQHFPHLTGRIQTITFEEQGSLETLRKLLTGGHVLVTSREFAEMLQAYYSLVRLHVSREGHYSTVGNFAMRHGLRADITRKLARLWHGIFAFGLLAKIDRTIFMGNLLTSLRKHRPSLVTTSTTFKRPDQPQTGRHHRASSRARHSVLTYLYLYLIGITLSIAVFAIELITIACGIR